MLGTEKETRPSPAGTGTVGRISNINQPNLSTISLDRQPANLGWAESERELRMVRCTFHRPTGEIITATRQEIAGELEAAYLGLKSFLVENASFEEVHIYEDPHQEFVFNAQGCEEDTVVSLLNAQLSKRRDLETYSDLEILAASIWILQGWAMMVANEVSLRSVRHSVHGPLKTLERCELALEEALAHA